MQQFLVHSFQAYGNIQNTLLSTVQDLLIMIIFENMQIKLLFICIFIVVLSTNTSFAFQEANFKLREERQYWNFFGKFLIIFPKNLERRRFSWKALFQLFLVATILVWTIAKLIVSLILLSKWLSSNVIISILKNKKN